MAHHSIRCFIESCRAKEGLLLPRVHQGTIPALGYTFERPGSHYYGISLDLAAGKLKTELESDKVTWKGQIHLHYSDGFRILENDRFTYFLGFGAGYLWVLMEYPVWDESRAYWSTSLSLGPYNSLVVDLKNGIQWISSLDLGLIGLFSRPDEIRLYAQEEWTVSNVMKITHSHLRPAWVPSICIIQFETEYRLPLKKDHFLSFFYSLLYSRTGYENQTALYISRNNFGLKMGF